MLLTVIKQNKELFCFLNYLDFSSRKDYYEECLKIIKIEFDPNSKEYKSTYSDNMGKYSENLKKEKEYGNKVMEFIKNITQFSKQYKMSVKRKAE